LVFSENSSHHPLMVYSGTAMLTIPQNTKANPAIKLRKFLR
jgi:hypothetical protein